MVMVLRKLFKLNHSVKWHDSCRLKYKIQLHKAKKRKTPREENTAAAATKFTRRSIEHPSALSVTNQYERARKCALKLEDKTLLAKLSAGT